MAVFGFVACPGGIFAQSGAGSVQGTVVDSTGAVVPGALIHVVNRATGVASGTKSNNVGFYIVPDLFTGTYEVSISALNMKTLVQTIDLQVDQHAVINPVMVLGAQTEKVTVYADVEQLVTYDSGTLSTSLDNTRINQLPMNTRLLLTQIGRTSPGLETYNGNSPGERANGLEAEAMEYVVDGAPVDNRDFGGSNLSAQAQFPDPDAVQEVTVNTSNPSAKYATPGVGVITTKSGTNQFHGSLFYTGVNNYWGVAKTRNQAPNFVEPRYIRNEFGGSAGGPIILPHVYHGKDKSFWFFAYERFSLAQHSAQLVTVPTAAMRNGDFSQLLNEATPVILYDPSTTVSSSTCPVPFSKTGATEVNQYCRTQFNYNGNPNTINPGLLNPTTKLLYSMTPLPEYPNNDPLSGQGNYLALSSGVPFYQTVPNYSLRIDHEFNEANKAYVHYSSGNQIIELASANLAPTLSVPNFPAAASGLTVEPVRNFDAAIGYTHIFSPTFYSETVLSQQWFRQDVEGYGQILTNYSKLLGVPNPFGNSGFPGISGMHVGGYKGTEYSYGYDQIESMIDENLTKIVGKHQFQFGGRYRHERLFSLAAQSADGPTFSDGQQTGIYNMSSSKTVGTGSAYSHTGYADADFFLGSPSNYTAIQRPPNVFWAQQEIDGYFQDNWHPRKDLTVNLGLRYEDHPSWGLKGNLWARVDMKTHAIAVSVPVSQLVSQGYTTQGMIDNLTAIGVAFETPGAAGYPSTVIVNSPLNLEPRVGLAWQPFNNKWGTVLRGAYGRYTYPAPTRSVGAGGPPFSGATYSQNYTNSVYSPDSLPNYQLRNPQKVFLGVNDANVISTAFKGLGTGILPGYGPPGGTPDIKPDQVTEVNATLEQPLKSNSVLRFSWVWTHATNLDQIYYPNLLVGNASNPAVWEISTGTDIPAGTTIGSPTYGATATNPWDNTVYGNFSYQEKTGWSNDNSFLADYQRTFHNGLSYQIWYMYQRAFKIGGDSSRNGVLYPVQDYLGGGGSPINPNVTITAAHPYQPMLAPPARPSNLASWQSWHELDRWEQYGLDNSYSLPPQHVQFNWVYDLPIGRGKMFLGKANRLVDELLGGYQIAGDGQVVSQIFNVAAGTNFGAVNPVKIYKHGAPITDCTSGTCYKEYLWFNGYIQPKQIQGANCSKNCISGLPADYVPFQGPINTDPVNDGANYNTNNVVISGANLKAGGETIYYGPRGTGTQPSGTPAISPYSKKFIYGPWNYTADATLQKTFPLTERYKLGIKWDVFNFLNAQGYANPDQGSGIQKFQAGGAPGASSYWPGRQMQFSLRLNF